MGTERFAEERRAIGPQLANGPVGGPKQVRFEDDLDRCGLYRFAARETP